MSVPTVRGRFVWHELMTTDVESAARFYPKVVGWEMQAWDHDPSYRMFATKDVPMAGYMLLPEDARQAGAPPPVGRSKTRIFGRDPDPRTNARTTTDAPPSISVVPGVTRMEIGAFGAAAADVLHVLEHTEILATPVAAARINANLEKLEQQAKRVMAAEGIAASRQRFEFSLDLRHKGQINEVEVLLPWTRAAAGYEAALRRMFVARYEQLYGRGSALAGAQLEHAGLPPQADELEHVGQGHRLDVAGERHGTPTLLGPPTVRNAGTSRRRLQTGSRLLAADA